MARLKTNTILLGVAAIFLLAYWRVSSDYLASANYSVESLVPPKGIKHIMNVASGTEPLVDVVPVTKGSPPEPPSTPAPPPSAPPPTKPKLPYGSPSPLLLDTKSGYSMSPDLPPDIGYEPKCSQADGMVDTPNPFKDGEVRASVRRRVYWMSLCTANTYVRSVAVANNSYASHFAQHCRFLVTVAFSLLTPTRR